MIVEVVVQITSLSHAPSVLPCNYCRIQQIKHPSPWAWSLANEFLSTRRALPTRSHGLDSSAYRVLTLTMTAPQSTALNNMFSMWIAKTCFLWKLCIYIYIKMYIYLYIYIQQTYNHCFMIYHHIFKVCFVPKIHAINMGTLRLWHHMRHRHLEDCATCERERYAHIIEI